MREETFIKDMLAHIEVEVGGKNPWDIQVHDKRFYNRLLRDKNLGLGESYMEGWWDCPRLDEFIYRILTGNLEERMKRSIKSLLPFITAFFFNQQSVRRHHIIAEKHYDTGNELFLSFLDPYNQYGCAYFDGTCDLAEAQMKKLDMICKKIHLSESDHVLDIGCGWGGFAKYVAERYACHVTAVNISEEQIRYAKNFCRDLPVVVINRDYRSIEGTFDKIVSIGMFEHVGYKNYKLFMQMAHRSLAEGGIFLLHTIGGNESRIKCDPWITKHIFPNGMLPSIKQISKAIEGLFVMEDWHNLGPHYDKTLMAWNENFQKSWPELAGKYDYKFKRMWEYYLLSCAGAFRARNIQLWQIVLTRYATEQPYCGI